MASAGRIKVAIIAFGHADNVVCLARTLAQYADVTLIFVTSGNRFTRSIFDWDLSKLPFGLTTDREIVRCYLGKEVAGFVGSRLNIHIARTPTRSVIRDWRRKNYRHISALAHYIRCNAFDVVHFNGFSGFQLHFHRLLRHIAKVYTVHDYQPHSGEWKITPVLLNKIYSKHTYHFIQHYDFLSRSFSSLFHVRPERVHTVRCGPLDVYKEYVNGNVPEEPDTVLFFGRISRYKGLEYLAQAASDIRQHVPDARITIAGKGDIYFSLNDKSMFEIHNRHVSNEELVRLLRRTRVVVAPYTDATHSAVVMTAFAFNKPVVASAVGGIPEVVEHGLTGMLVPPRHSPELAKAIVTLLTDHTLRRKIVRNINKVSRSGKLSWDNIAHRTIEVYEKALRDVRKK